MSETNDQESQLSNAIDGLNRLTEGKLLQFIQSLTAMLEEANARQRALESADPPSDGTAAEPEPPVSPKQDAGGTDAKMPAS